MASLNPSAIVIGAGFGGLSLALRLRALGFRVTLLEKGSEIGGRAGVIKEAGFTFDTGPTVITAPQLIDELFDLFGKKRSDYVELLEIDPFYRLHFESGYKLDYGKSAEHIEAQLMRKNPKDAAGYREFFEYSKRVFDQGYTRLADAPFHRMSTMLSAAPQLVKLNALRSVVQAVSSYIEDPDLIRAFSFHPLLIGGNPFSTPAIYTLIHYLERHWGVWFPKGGTHALVKALARLFVEAGGEIRTEAEVDQILVAGGKTKGVKLVSGEVVFADCVVSNADVVHTYEKLLRSEPVAQSKASKLASLDHSMSLFLIYFGTNRTYPDVAHHNVIFGPRYRELLKDIFEEGILPEDFSLYLHAPTRTDPSLAPHGHDSFYVLSPVPHLGKGKIDWEKTKHAYADRILKFLEERHLPDLTKHIVVKKIVTPLEFKSNFNAHLGSAFSLQPTFLQSAYFRVHNRDRHFSGLYFVGAGTHPGAGVPGVMNSAKATAAVIEEDFYGKTPDVWETRSFKEVLSAQKKQPNNPIPAFGGAYRYPEAYDPDLLVQAKTAIRKGSKSFYFASHFMPKAARETAWLIYSWCRHCDDQMDEPVLKPVLEKRAEVLRKLTQKALGFANDSGELSPPFRAIQMAAASASIPPQYPLDLILGMEWDAKGVTIADESELLRYCYFVAGTVGLMMAHAMRVSNPVAYKNAMSLGIAMQMTNIARDVFDDAREGRVYLPQNWMKEAGLDPRALLWQEVKPKVFQVVQKLLKVADRYYAVGNEGLKYLSFRSAISVGIASKVYHRIGQKITSPLSWSGRIHTRPIEKAWIALSAVFWVTGIWLKHRLFQKPSLLKTSAAGGGPSQ